MGSGGKRKGAGRKKKYGLKTTVVAFRCPVKKKKEFKKDVEKILSYYE
jgi:hypothetical protein